MIDLDTREEIINFTKQLSKTEIFRKGTGV